jgi:low temperature requirement protein LtrA
MTASHSLLRSRTAKDSSKVGWVELFFDLVFVFSVTQLSHLLIADLSWNGAAETGFLMLAVWAAWMWTTWAMNWLDTRHAAVRLLLFAMMAAGLVLSAAIPEAFAERALPFACAYVFIHNARGLFIVFALRKGPPNEYVNFIRIEIWLAFSALFWIAGALAEGDGRWALWLAALTMDYGAPWVLFWCPGLGSSKIDDWNVNAAHIAERCGLFVIIALGESVIMTGAAFAELRLDIFTAAAFAASFVGVVAMWWVYFATTAEEASELFEHRADPGAIARAAYTYAHIPIIAGIILSAVGDELVLAHPVGHTEPSVAVVLAGGPAIFLLGSGLFRSMVCGGVPVSHFAGLVLIALGTALFWSGPPIALGAATSIALCFVGAWEAIRRRREHHGPSPAHAAK